MGKEIKVKKRIHISVTIRKDLDIAGSGRNICSCRYVIFRADLSVARPRGRNLWNRVVVVCHTIVAAGLAGYIFR